MALERFIRDALDSPSPALSYQVSYRLAEMFPDRAIIEGSDCDFTLYDFVREGLCTVRHKAGVHAQTLVWWQEDKQVFDTPKNAWYEVSWRDHELEVLMLEWADDRHYWILAEAEPIARQFFQMVCAFNPDMSDEVLVFQGGGWHTSPGLFRDIQGASFDNLILAGTLKRDIRADLERFFASRPTYETLGAPWKRGLLLTGPPGNGKTHTIKALVQALGKPCIYVRSFKSECQTEETCISRIFERARKIAPAIVVLEDLDALVTDENRSFILNELDGFAQNTGLVILATTNHPEKLDPALVERPSRFDRKYHFGLPGRPERQSFLARWNANLPGAERLDEGALGRLAEVSEGFSFASLKELILASLLQKAATETPITMEEALAGQAGVLRAQMRPVGSTVV